MFLLNQFYRNLENPGGTTKVNDTPENSGEMATFWRDIWSLEKKHNQQATWIQTVKETQNNTVLHEIIACVKTSPHENASTPFLFESVCRIKHI